MIEKIRSIANNPSWIEMLFMAMILSFPFGSFFLSFSIGFMTIYPYLVLVVALSILSFFKTAKITAPLERYYLFFLLFFLAWAFASIPFIEGKSHAASDIRSIVLMLLTSYVFISAAKVLGYEKWRSVVLVSFKIIFFMVLAFSIFEIASGFHFSGAFTDKILERAIRDNYSATPVFLWDNPNNLSTYLILLGSAIMLLEPPTRQKYMLSWLILLSWFIISFIALSRIGLAITLLAVPFVLINQLRSFINENRPVFKKYFPYVACVLGIILLITLTKEKFYGIPITQERVYENTILKTELAEEGEALLLMPSRVDTIIEPVTAFGPGSESQRNSESERMALILNGFDFIRQSHLLGVGPGQYRYLHETNQIDHYTFGNNGAHFWLIELFSQYGIVVFGAYAVLLCWVLLSALRYWKRHSEIALNLLFCLGAFMAASVMPSAFLILDINWMFVVIMVMVCANLKEQKTTVV